MIPKATRKFRYRRDVGSASTTDTSITVAEIREALIALAATGTSAAILIKAFRLLRIDFWQLPFAGISANSTRGAISLTWAGDHDPNNSQSATPGVAQNAHIASRPPPHSSLGWWMSSSDDSEVAFTLSSQGVQEAALIVDLELEYVWEIATVSVATIASTAAGVYLTALDSSAATPLYLADAPAADRIDTQLT